MKYLKITNWNKYQQCDRNAPFVKLYTSLLSDYKFLNQRDSEKAFFCCAILFCAKNGNKIPADSKFLTRVFCLENEIDLQKFIDSGFLEEWTEGKHIEEQISRSKRIEKRKEDDRIRYHKNKTKGVKKSKRKSSESEEKFSESEEKFSVSEFPLFCTTETEKERKEERKEEKGEKKVKANTPFQPPHFKTPPTPPTKPNGVLKNLKNGGEEKPRNTSWNILYQIGDAALAKAKRNAPGWDIGFLANIYNQGIAERGKPSYPDKAFPVWCFNYTKGKPPNGG